MEITFPQKLFLPKFKISYTLLFMAIQLLN